MRRLLALSAGFALVFMFAPPVSAAADATCAGGPIAPGVYGTLTVTGDCVVTGGSITVADGLVVAPGASLTAITSAATVSVSGGIWVGKDAILLFGCAPSITEVCGPDSAYSVRDGIHADHAMAMILHGNTIRGGITIHGGGGGLSCEPVIFGFLPAYSTIENNHISGAVEVTGLSSCWFGMARNHINGAVTLSGNTFGDPDAMEILANSINGRLACSGNSPVATNWADKADGGPQMPNTVTGQRFGECVGL